jgi:two-component system, NarL family, invasion response regulator UvrY
MIKIIIADDHAIVRKGLKQILEETPDLIVADEAGNGQEVIDKVRKNSFDIVILDMTMPGKGGVDTLKELKILKPDLPVLVLSVHPEEQYAMRVLKSGAAGYVNKESAPNELIDAIRRVASGRKYISAFLAEKLALNLDNDYEKPIHEILSDREFQVMCKIALGKTVTEIANELNLSIKTISTYRTRILEKMDMKSSAEIARYAIKNSLVD